MNKTTRQMVKQWERGYVYLGYSLPDIVSLARQIWGRILGKNLVNDISQLYNEIWEEIDAVNPFNHNTNKEE